MTRGIRIILLLWQLELVNTFTMLQFFINSGVQYSAIVAGSAAGNFSNISRRVWLEPIVGLQVALEFINIAEGNEKRMRIASIAALLSASLIGLNTDPTTNAALGGAVASHISYMKTIIDVRGGASNISDHILISRLANFKVKINNGCIPLEKQQIVRLITPYEMQFNENCDLIMKNIVAEQTARRYIQGSTNKLNFIQASRPCIAIPVASSQLINTRLINFIGIGVVSLIIVGGVCVYLLKRKPFQNNRTRIDTTGYIINHN